MAFIKLVKNKAYYKRFQVKYRRRREGKTDYYARRKLVAQSKNKYNTPKYRLVVRFSNKNVIAQVAYATIEGDRIIAAAYATELPRYGIKVGLTNYAACYAVGLLCARRLLAKLGLADQYKGNTEAAAPSEDGGLYHVEAEGDSRPFRCFLDVGLVRTTTGSKVFAVMKGAVDGGLDIPHNEKRFPGYEKESNDWVDTLREHVFGGHVAEYMTHLQEEDEERYKKQFASYIKHGITGDSLEAMYESAHAAIRDDPSHKPTEKKVPEVQKRYYRVKMSREQRKDRVRQKMNTFKAVHGLVSVPVA